MKFRPPARTGDPANWVRRRSPPAMKRRAIGAGRRQMGGAVRPLLDELLCKGPGGPHRQPRCGVEWPRRVDAKGAGISHARLLRAEWSPSLAENGGIKGFAGPAGSTDGGARQLHRDVRCSKSDLDLGKGVNQATQCLTLQIGRARGRRGELAADDEGRL